MIANAEAADARPGHVEHAVIHLVALKVHTVFLQSNYGENKIRVKNENELKFFYLIVAGVATALADLTFRKPIAVHSILELQVEHTQNSKFKFCKFISALFFFRNSKFFFFFFLFAQLHV